MISPEERAALAAVLAERKLVLVADIRAKQSESRRLAGANPPGEVVDGGDSAMNAVLAEVDLAEAERGLGELREIEAAETRLSDGSYGQCVGCGAAIAPARLAAHPTASRCTACQTKYEQAHPGAGR